MKQIALILLIFFLAALPAHAQTDWVINNFQTTESIQNDGTVNVTETIDVDFHSLEKHGIYRDLPYVYEDPQGKKTYTKIDNISVQQDGSEEKYDLINNDNNLRIRIGDADQTISGKHIYKLTYRASGVLRSFTDHDELYWNVTGNDWEVPIDKASATVTVPKEKIEKTTCFEGIVGATDPCSITNQTQTSATFMNTKPLAAGEGLTIVVGYTKGMVPIVTVAPPKRIEDDLLTQSSLFAFLFTFIGGFIVVLWLWARKGRDFWFKTRQVLDPNARQETKPLGAHETIVVEFEPPEKLRPAELGVLMDENADTLDVTATIIDLANRGFLSIEELEKKWIFGSKDYSLKRTKLTADKLVPYEALLLKKLFADGQSITVSKLKKTFYEELAAVKKQLYQDVMDKKLFVARPDEIRSRYLGFGVGVLLLGGVFIFAGLKLIVGPFVTAGCGVILSSIFIFIMAKHMPRRTALGREIYQRTKGYQLFIGGAEKYRQQFYEKKNLFNEILPYAIVFGLTGKFAKAMKDMGIKQQNPGWYSGTHAFVPMVFVSDVNDFSKSLSTAIASTPSSSGGFSGGSSGGGFSGGGGGSW